MLLDASRLRELARRLGYKAAAVGAAEGPAEVAQHAVGGRLEQVLLGVPAERGPE